jgi:ribonuclease HII
MQQTGLDFFAEQEQLIAGVDEAGRGPLAGPVVCGAVILDPAKPIAGLNDSKKLTEKRREALYEEIIAKAKAWAIDKKGPAEIDELNILQASLKGMADAVAALPIQPDHVRVDGNQCPKVPMTVEAIVGGDASDPAIAAASILAKVHRDRLLVALHQQHPEYGFDKHKGYPTKQHMQALAEHGVLDCHRRSYAPVRKALAKSA